MSKCKSCGGSLKLHGISPLDEKICFVCYLAKMNNKHIDKISDLEAKLVEKEKEIEKLKEVVGCVDKLKQFNADMKDYALVNKDVADEIYYEYQAKTDFAIEQLEKVKEYLKDRIKIIEGDECIYDIDEIVGASCENKKTLEKIDQQIKELKEKTNKSVCR